MYRSRINYLILLLLSLIFTHNVYALVKPTSKFYINDYANVLSDETEEYIYNKSVQLNNVDGTQIVVVTVPNLEGRSIEDYSLEVARSFKIGSEEKDNGLLLLLALEERMFRVEVGEGLEGILPDGKTGRFQDQYIIPYLKDDLYDEGIKNGYDAFFNEIVILNNLDLETMVPRERENSVVRLEFIILAGALGFLAGIYLGILDDKNLNFSKIYVVIWLFAYLFAFVVYDILKFYLVINFLTFIFGRFIFSSNYTGRGSRMYPRSSYNGTHTYHSGGGGSFGGGGSSRHF